MLRRFASWLARWAANSRVDMPEWVKPPRVHYENRISGFWDYPEKEPEDKVADINVEREKRKKRYF